MTRADGRASPYRIAEMRNVLAAEGRSAAIPFAVAVAEQADRHDPPSGDGAQSSGGESGIVDRVLAVLRETASARAARLLVRDPPLLAAVFQNVDLLYEHGYADADAVSRAVMEALAMLDEPD